MPPVRTPKIGLPQGYVKFGSNAHLMLEAIRDYGPLRHTDFVRILGLPKGVVSANIQRLVDADKRFIYLHGRVRVDNDTRLQDLWGLEPKGSKPFRHEPFTRNELVDRHRQKKSVKVASVWQFRPIVRQKCKPTTK